MRNARYRTLIQVASGLVLFDQLAKIWVTSRLELHQSISVIPGFFNLTYVQNPGAAFGMLAATNPGLRIPLFLTIPVLALVAIIWLFKKMSDQQTLLVWALSLILGGAIGNFIDRARLQFVIDFLDFHWQSSYHFHVFNFADAGISVGAALLAWEIYVRRKPLRGNSSKGL